MSYTNLCWGTENNNKNMKSMAANSEKEILGIIRDMYTI